jgi:hypothetical protein
MLVYSFHGTEMGLVPLVGLAFGDEQHSSIRSTSNCVAVLSSPFAFMPLSTYMYQYRHSSTASIPPKNHKNEVEIISDYHYPKSA